MTDEQKDNKPGLRDLLKKILPDAEPINSDDIDPINQRAN